MKLAVLALALPFLACNSTPKAEPSGSPAVAANSGAVSASTPAPPSGGLLPVGASAPAVTTTAHDGSKFDLGALRGRAVVVYFYPKDDTPGCTVQAEGVRDEWPKLEKTGAVIVGVSTDDAASHKAFAEKYKLPFALLPDTDQSIAKAFGVPVNMGYAKRVTFVIDKDGRIAKVFPEVTPRTHAGELIAALNAL